MAGHTPWREIRRQRDDETPAQRARRAILRQSMEEELHLAYLREDAFMLVDLESQAKAAFRHTRGQTQEQFIAWLARRGTLIDLHHGTYWFISPFGIGTGFRFTSGRHFIIILGQVHTTLDPLRDEPDDNI